MEFTQKNGLVEHVIYYNSSLDYVLYDGGSLAKKDALKKYFNFEVWQEQRLYEQFTDSSIGYIPKNERGSGKDTYITIYFSPQYMLEENKFLFLLPEKRMRELFKNVYSGNQFMIVSEKGDTIVSPEAAIHDEKLTAHLLDSIEKNGNGHFHHEDYLVMHEKSGIFDWEYTALIQYDDIYKGVSSIRNITLYLVLSIVLVGAVVIVMSIRQTYLPLKEILNSVSGGKRGEDETEYDKIRQSIQNLQENNQVYREQQVLNKMIRHGAGEAELKEFFRRSQVCGIYLTGSGADRAEELKDYFENCLRHVYHEIRLVRSSRNEGYLIFNEEELDSGAIQKVLEDFCTEHRPKLWMGVGTVEEVRNLKISCDNGRIAVKEGRVAHPGHVYGPDTDEKCSFVCFPFDFESSMMFHIYAADKEQVRGLVADVLRQNRQISWSSLEKLLMVFHESYRHIADKLRLDGEEEAWKEVFAQKRDLDELEAVLPGLYEALVFETPVDKRSEYVGKYVKEYVARCYQDPGITIEGIAGELNLVPTYVSTLFKKEANISFSQYLSDYRIQKAKELLEQTDMKIKDVAFETGFGTYNNFTRVFKKKLGITPNEYKNQMQEL